MTWHGHKSFSVAHDDMFTLPYHPESDFFESSYGVEMVDAWELPHGLCRDVYFVRFLITAQLSCRS